MQAMESEYIAGFRRKFEQLVRLIRSNKEITNYSKLRKAFDLIVNTYGHEVESGGHQEINSAIEVSEIAITEIGLGMTSVLGIFLIRVFKKGLVGMAEIEKEFDKPVAIITGGLDSIYELGNKTIAPQAENFRNLLLNLAGDVRVILIKIAEQLHTMRSMKSLPEEEQIRLSSEASFLYSSGTSTRFLHHQIGNGGPGP